MQLSPSQSVLGVKAGPMSTSHMWLTTPPFASALWVGPLVEGSEREGFPPLFSWLAVLLCGSGQGPGGGVGWGGVVTSGS